MFKNRKLIILSALLLLIVLIGSVSAAEVDDLQQVDQDGAGEIITDEVSSAGTDSGSELDSDNDLSLKSSNGLNTVSENNDDGNVLTAEHQVYGSTFQDIQDAIDAASDGDTIYLNSQLYTGSGTYITVDKKPLTIIGCEGCTLDAQNKSPIIWMEYHSHSLQIKNIKFINGIGDIEDEGMVVGAAIHIVGSNNTISDCTFNDNKGWLGAICVSGTAKNNTISSCHFENNNGTHLGGAIYAAYTSLDISGCTFANNNANLEGGAIYVLGIGRGDFNIHDCTFENNHAGDGGAISVQNNNVTISECNFNNNSAGEGGAIDVDPTCNCAISKSTFLDNKANARELDTTLHGSVLEIRFAGNETHINAINHEGTGLSMQDVVYWNGDVVNSKDVGLSTFSGIDITIEIYDSEGNLVENVTKMTGDDGLIQYDYSHLGNRAASYKVYHTEDTYYTDIETTGKFPLVISVISNNPSATVGDSVSFTIIVTNNGDEDLKDITVENIFPDGLVYTGFDGSGWSKVSSSSSVGAYKISILTAGSDESSDDNKFAYSGVLGAGESASYTLYFDTTKEGTFTVEATASSNLVSGVYGNGSTVVSKVPETEPDTNSSESPSDNSSDSPNESPSDDSSDSPSESPSDDSSDSPSGSDSVSMKETGNPIFLLVLAILACLPILRREE